MALPCAFWRCEPDSPPPSGYEGGVTNDHRNSHAAEEPDSNRGGHRCICDHGDERAHQCTLPNTPNIANCTRSLA